MENKLAFDSIPKDILDIGKALEFTGVDLDTFRELLGIFLQHVPSVAEDIQDGVISGDAVKVLKAAHTIKGSAANIHAGRIIEIAKAIEKSAGEGELEIVKDLLNGLSNEMSVLANYSGKISR
jgi:HPt (histidine-containing phosphotransfer) domain-containing protein